MTPVKERSTVFVQADFVQDSLLSVRKIEMPAEQSPADLQVMGKETCQAGNKHGWVLYLLETKYHQINACKGGSYNTWSCILL